MRPLLPYMLLSLFKRKKIKLSVRRVNLGSMETNSAGGTKKKKLNASNGEMGFSISALFT